MSDLLTVNICAACGRTLAAHRDARNRSKGCAYACRQEQASQPTPAEATEPIGHLEIVNRLTKALHEERV